MIPKLYQKDGTTLIGNLTNCIECLVEEERNGLFEITLTYPNEEIASSLEYDNIIICDANDTLKNQKFRIYDTRRMMNDTIDVYARHISFDLAYDYINSIDITNQSCEYALNTIFRSSQFSTGYVGHSDIVNAQNYKISNCNALEAIAGKQGSIIDTYGTGAEILRDNTDIYVLNRRGNDNEVSIEYAKNLTGFELQENTDDLITRIIPFATYTPEGGTQTRVDGPTCNSQYINNYSHPFIAEIDFSDKFEDNEVPTASKLQTLAEKYFTDNKCDLPKQNWKIEFIPLSKCVGYEGIEDAISLCDTVTIKDTRYNIDTKAKVIKTVYDVLRERYDSMELGEPRTTLGDIVNTGSEKGEQGPPGPQGPKGEDGNIGDFPDSVPAKPVLTTTLLGFASIQLDWTYDNKPYYWYEVYASKTKDFTPNVFDIVHKGQTSSFLFQAKPGETWYFRVCGVNSYDHRSGFSDQKEVITTKVDNLSNYFTTAAIGHAVVGIFTAEYMTAGILKGQWIDAKNLSVTDGNGKRTLDIDSFGNVNLDVTSLKIKSNDVATKGELELTKDSLTTTFTTDEGYNLLINSLFENNDIGYWDLWGEGAFRWTQNMSYYKREGEMWLGTSNITNSLTLAQKRSFNCSPNEEFYFSLVSRREVYAGYCSVKILFMDSSDTIISAHEQAIEQSNARVKYKFIVPNNVNIVKGRFTIVISNPTDTQANLTYIYKPCLTRGNHNGWIASPDDNYTVDEVNSIIEQTASSIRTEVSAKTSAGDVKSIIEQNPNSVQIGFNNINNSVEVTSDYFKFKDSNGDDIFKASGSEVLITGTKTKVTEALDILNIGANRIISLENENYLNIVLKDRLGNYYCTPMIVKDTGIQINGDIIAGGYDLGVEGESFNKAYIGDFLTSETGYTNLPNNMLIQWGFTFVQGPSGSTITFPKVFTCTNPVIVISPASGELTNITQSAWITGFNKYNFYARCTSETNCKWIAIGW